MKTKTKLLAGLMLAVILTLLSMSLSAQSTRWYINFPSAVVVLSDSASPENAVGAYGEGTIKFRVKEGETIYCTILDIATMDTFKLEIHYTGNYYEDYQFKYEGAKLD